MPDNPLTPEKELLRLIEKPLAKNSLSAAAIKHQGLSFLSAGALKGRFAFLKHRLRGFSKNTAGVKQLDVRVLNLGLELLIFSLAAYLIFNSVFSAMSLKKDVNFQLNAAAAAEAKYSEARSILKAASYYLEKARSRDIFKMVAMKNPETGALEKKPPKELLEAAQNYKLVGISWSSDPDVMIEDIKNKRTVFLKKGQMVNNDVKLEAVFKDKVILTFRGAEIELR